jgi:DNA-binding transcriptional ArsR family regulator
MREEVSLQTDRVFAALSNATRRAMLDRLVQGPVTAGDLGLPFALSQPTISAHLKVLEEAGLVRRGKAGTTRPVMLATEALEHAHRWMSEYERFWLGRLDRMEDVARALQDAETNGDGDGQGE